MPKSDFAGLLPETQQSFKMTVSDPNEASCRTRKQQNLLPRIACADLDLGLLGFARPSYGQPLCSWAGPPSLDLAHGCCRCMCLESFCRAPPRCRAAALHHALWIGQTQSLVPGDLLYGCMD